MKLQFIIFAIFVVGTNCKHASAEMLMTLWGEPESSIVSFELSGSARAKGFNEDIIVAGTAFLVTDDYDPFPPEMPRDPGLNLLSGGGTITNGHQSFPIAGILAFDGRSSVHGMDGFGVFWPNDETPPGFFVLDFDLFTWEGAGTVELPDGLVFADLNPGMGVAEASIFSIGPFLEGRLIIIPEPSSFASLLLAIPLLRRRRRTLGRTN